MNILHWFRTHKFTDAEQLIIMYLVLIMLGVAVVGALGFFGNRPRHTARNACINQLRMIEGAKEQWGLEHHMEVVNTPTPEDLFGLSGYMKFTPTCPSSGSNYFIGTLGERPRCSVPGHSL